MGTVTQHAPGTFCWPELATTDPAGARTFYAALFSVWQAGKHIGAHRLNEVGALCWTELMTTDATAAERFYGRLFPWKPEQMPMGPGMTYTVFKRGEAPAAGMMQITPEMGPMPPNWMVYFQVASCDGTVAKAASLGARVVVPPQDVPSVGRFATLQDPQGAHFAIFQF